MTPDIEILPVGALPSSDEEQLASSYRVHYLYAARGKDAFRAGCAYGIRTFLMRGELGANTALIAELARLELVAIYGVGDDADDMDLCYRRGIRVTNTPDVLTADIASNVDEAALLDALETGALGAAALDVFENEPRLDQRFVGLTNVLLQPHHGSATVETREAMGQLLRDNLAAHFGGRALPTPLN